MSAKKVEKPCQKPKNKALDPNSSVSQNATKSTKKMKLNQKIVQGQGSDEKELIKLNLKNNTNQRNNQMDENEEIKDLVLKKRTRFSEKQLFNDYMKNVFFQGNTVEEYTCKSCHESGQVENLFRHLQSKKHEAQTELKDMSALKEAIKLGLEKKKSGKSITNQLFANESDIKANYLEFISFLMAQKLSYSQIEKIGNFFKCFNEKNKLGFLKKFSFKQEKISKIATNCLRPCLLQEIHNDLEKQKFSFSVDGSTIAGQNTCAIQVKYLREEVDEETKRVKSTIVNRLLGLSTFKESSESLVYLQMLKEKLFTNPQISANFVGTAHDHAKTLTGEENGLVGLLEKEGYSFFDLRDPCHGLSLALRNSVGQLPQEIMTFITKLHSHFVSPQRKAQLTRIQETRGEVRSVVLKTYVKTRWLSLGNSLERVIRLWEPLEIYE